ncbi:MAG: DUF222 domain-containing protein [Pseudonocardiaceae bacterium]
MSGRQVIPGDLADIPPGPRLSQVLSGIDLTRLSGFDCVEVLKARYRQLNHDRAQLMAAMVEVGLCGIGPDDELPRRAIPDEFSADEVRAALVLTRRAADAQFSLAYDLITRLPAVHAALDAGRIDEPRARVLSEWTTDLTPDQGRAVCDTLLPRVPTQTTGQLIDQIKKLAIAIDPEWAQRRYEQAVAARKVVGYRNPDGSANLSGLNLPVDRVAAASGHIDALAKAAKHAGDPRPVDHIRADLFLGMTDGTYTGLDDVAILDELRTTHHSDDEGPGDEGPGDGPGGGPGDDGPDDGGGAADGGRRAAGDLVESRGLAGAGMELRVRLSTLLGRDEYPGELAGWGPVHAELARDLATAMARGQWRFAITDEHGHLLNCGITQARPTGAPTRSAGSRQIVELQIPAATLHDLASDPTALRGWAPVITDLAHQHTTGQRPPAGDPTRRFPGAALRRYVQIRDRYCLMIGCRAPAHGTDTDHTLDHARSGPTVEHNLGNACKHDHRLKHEGGWQLHQPEPGLFRWTSRLGHVYPVRPPPIIEPLPDPIPRNGPTPPLFVQPDGDWDESSIWDDTPLEVDTTPSPRPPPEPEACDETPPPF